MYTPSSDYYLSPDVYHFQQTQLFTSSWQYVPTPTSELTPFMMLPECVDAALLIGQNDEIAYALSNVCTHRGALMYKTATSAKTLRCPYHGRSFDTQGKCLAMPYFDQVKDFPQPFDHLPNRQVFSWNFLSFVSLKEPWIDFDAWVAPLNERLWFLPFEDFIFSSEQSRDYDLAANWMLYCDNYLEGLHIPYVHPALFKALNFNAYETHNLPYGVLQVGLADDNEIAFDLPPEHPDYGKRVGAFYYWLFPNLMLNFYPWGLSLNRIEPQGLQKTRVRYLTWVYRPEYLDQGAGGDIDTTEYEDHDVILRVQQGLKSPFYDKGQYAPEIEKGMRHFHELLRQHRDFVTDPL